MREEKQQRLSRTKAIREYCLMCNCYQSKEVRLCPSIDCPLHRYRMGKEERDELYYQNKKISVIE